MRITTALMVMPRAITVMLRLLELLHFLLHVLEHRVHLSVSSSSICWSSWSPGTSGYD